MNKLLYKYRSWRDKSLRKQGFVRIAFAIGLAPFPCLSVSVTTVKTGDFSFEEAYLAYLERLPELKKRYRSYRWRFEIENCCMRLKPEASSKLCNPFRCFCK